MQRKYDCPCWQDAVPEVVVPRSRFIAHQPYLLSTRELDVIWNDVDDKHKLSLASRRSVLAVCSEMCACVFHELAKFLRATFGKRLSKSWNLDQIM
mmetsp:Transcript_59633/g.94677  ORF Transcript_59633/g.94677 Transcript_59633/m.94677 type:complete len:96 (+) Transcript_59633:1939-2226(+)